ncbi:hypothetical protein VIGAN_08242300 [Vigna angularis var. angularis]|uniref:Amino acid transporter transmembrane domain-containing protein n=1 Tax=Vigna angularis var. angularis TaxID=157739 RepID=A0A0S3SS48_PHAAN|nr:hypothetical protein VIGAN_08242300 [Vigna angularis var. angularis]
MFLISLLFVAFAALSYFAFGEETQGVITTNLGPGMISALVQLGLGINLFFTFPLMMNPVNKLVERRLWNFKYCLWLRWLLVLAIFGATDYANSLSEWIRSADGCRGRSPV